MGIGGPLTAAFVPVGNDVIHAKETHGRAGETRPTARRGDSHPLAFCEVSSVADSKMADYACSSSRPHDLNRSFWKYSQGRNCALKRGMPNRARLLCMA